MAFTVPTLDYEYSALEPHIDEETMRIHHDKHHQAYVDKLNAALEGNPELQTKHIEELVAALSTLPEGIQVAVKNHGGGHANHSFFWKILKKDVTPSGPVVEAINAKWGSLEKLQEEFSTAALSVFGSGWAWLVWNGSELEVMKTANQDSPLTDGKIPLLGVDMWEHSFYVKHRQDKASYLKDFWSVINWERVNVNFQNAQQ